MKNILPLNLYVSRHQIFEKLYNGYQEFILLEKKGLFNSCEPIADYIIETIVSKIENNELKKIDGHFIGLKNTITKEDCPQLFTDEIRVDIYFDDKFGELHASTNNDGETPRPIVIGIYAPYSDKLDLSELKAILFHELTHYMVGDLMFSNGYTGENNFFIQNSIQKPDTDDDIDNIEEYVINILYRLNKHEQNAFNSMVRQYLKIYQERDFNKIIEKFKTNKFFVTLFDLEWMVSTKYYENIFEDWGIPNFVELYKKYMNRENNKNWSNQKVFNSFKDKIKKALEKFKENVDRQLKDLLSENNFNDKWLGKFIDVKKYYVLEHRNSYNIIYKNF